MITFKLTDDITPDDIRYAVQNMVDIKPQALFDATGRRIGVVLTDEFLEWTLVNCTVFKFDRCVGYIARPSGDPQSWFDNDAWVIFNKDNVRLGEVRCCAGYEYEVSGHERRQPDLDHAVFVCFPKESLNGETGG